jgi:hypothetical protein
MVGLANHRCPDAILFPSPALMETREGLIPNRSVETEDNSIGEQSRRSQPDYNRLETLCLRK